ncbi:hypothetical protein L2E82_51782 [Cichorium intybus]|nr:hypothetical protein L2E82_51782 [Cichorium intybus]
MANTTGKISTYVHNSGPNRIVVGNGSHIPIHGSGHTTLPPPFPPLKLYNILHAPHLIKNLLSIRRLTTDNSVAVEFDPFGLLVKDYQTQIPILRCDSTGDLYPLTQPNAQVTSPSTFAALSQDLWHHCLGHPGSSSLRILYKNNFISFRTSSNKNICQSCVFGKQIKLPFHTSTSFTSLPFDIVHSDLWTSPVLSSGGHRYYVLFIDDFTNYLWTFPLSNKSQVFSIFLAFYNHITTQFERPIKTFQCDNGTEYNNKLFHNFCTANSMTFRFSCPHTSPQNGKAERTIHTINNMVRTLLSHASLPTSFWHHALQMTTYLLNILPHKTKQYFTPTSLLYHKHPTYDHLKVFGCLCFPLTPSTSINKLQNRSSPCVFLDATLPPNCHASYSPTGGAPPLLHTYSRRRPSHAPPPPPPQPTRTMTTRSMSGITKPKQPTSLHTSTTTTIAPLPRNPIEALSIPEWNHAMTDEFNALIDNNTWDLVPRRPDMNIIRCMWIFKHKTNTDGSLERYKARLVCDGRSQQVGVDCDETFSPVVKPASIRTVLSIALHKQWVIHQLDVKNAFLHGQLSETVFMYQPLGFRDSTHPNHVCRLKRSLYGLKQAPRAWYQRFTDYVTTIGFQHSTCDHSLFIYRHGRDTAYLLLYVDDIIFTASSQSLHTHLLSCLSSEFAMKDLGPLHYFLGISVKRDATGMFLSQEKYASDIISRANMENCNPVQTPLNTTGKLSNDAGSLIDNPSTYRSLAGALQYLTFTRPDISYAVQQVCMHMHAPKTAHWDALKRIIRYIKGTVRMGLHMSASSPVNLVAYTDAD